MVGCQILMDKLVMVKRRGSNGNSNNGEGEKHNLLRIKIVLSPLTL